MTPAETIHTDAMERLRGDWWHDLWTPAMANRIADALSFIWGYPMGEHLWGLDVLVCGGFPYDFSKANPQIGTYLLVAEVREESLYTGRRIAWLKAVFRASSLSLAAWERVHLANELMRRSVVDVPYWTWRKARERAGARPLPPKQTIIPDI